MLRYALSLGALAALFSPALPARAQPAAAGPPRATIVRIEGDDVLLDIGAAALDGARTLTVYRLVTVRHPLTRKPLEDRFSIGELDVVQARETLTLARARGTPSHPFAV